MVGTSLPGQSRSSVVPNNSCRICDVASYFDECWDLMRNLLDLLIRLMKGLCVFKRINTPQEGGGKHEPK